MPRGSKAKYTEKQKRMAEHIEEGYEQKGVSEKTAESRAWATVNKLTGGGMKGGSGSEAKAARRRPLARKNAKKAGAKGGRKRAATARKSTTRGTRKATRTGSKATSRTGTAGRRASTKRTSGASKSRSTTSKRGGSRTGSRKSTRGKRGTRR